MMERENLKKGIQELIEKFENMKSSQSDYSEQDVQTKLIKPLFKLLGWDVDGKIDPTEVKEEVNYSGNRVDLKFSINLTTKLIVESKKFTSKLDLKGDFRKKAVDKSAIYGHSAGVSCVVLTNFERFVFIDSQKQYSSSEETIFREFSYKELLTESGLRALDLISKKGFENNLLEGELKQIPGRGLLKKPINEQLLEELLNWRYDLYRDIKSRYSKFSKEKIDEIIQIILNRLLFIRMCEDKGFIDNFNLYSLIHEFEDKEMKNIFNRIEQIYDGSLFQEHDCDGIIISKKVLKDIIFQLYYSKDRNIKYYFSAIPSDILGKMYEQYLNTIVNENKTEFSPKIKKEGIHYTDKRIVTYMLENVFSEFLKNNKDLSKIKILDSACGSGSFLVGAYEYLENYYLKKGELTYEKKYEILKNNLFGVDKDARAIEIARLNLHFKILEKDKKLPFFDNLKVGDSLVEDYKIAKDKAFKWNEKFLFKFDIIIGNPPYVRQELIIPIKDYLKKHYEVYNGTADIYTYFYEKGFKLLNEKGILCFISSNKFMRAKYGIDLRKFLKNKTRIIKIIDFKEKRLFEAITNTSIFLARNDYARGNKFNFGNDIGKDKNYFFQDDLKDSEWTLVDEKILEIKNKIEQQGILLKNWKVKIYSGLNTGYNPAFIINNKDKEELCKKNIKNEVLMKKVIRGRDINKWGYDWKGFWLLFIPWHFPLNSDSTIKHSSKIAEREFSNNYPIVYNYLLKHKGKLSKRNKAETNIRYEWYALKRYGSDYHQDFKKEKIIWIELSDENKFAYSKKGEFVLAGAFMMTGEHLKYLLCFLNSKLCKFYFKLICNSSGMDTIQWKKFAIERIPIKKISEKEEKKFNELADKMIYLVEKSKNSNEDDDIFDEIKNTESEINNLVFEVNSLDGEDIRIIDEYLMNN